MLSKTPWLVLGISISVTFAVWFGFINFQNQLHGNDFDSHTEEITNTISNRIGQYEQVLVGAKGFLSHSSEITPELWEIFVDIQMISRYPDVQGVGFAKHVTGEHEATELVTQMQKHGFEDFSIFPKGQRSEYYPIVFLEPLDIKNKRAIGYDSYFEETRKNSMDLSIKSNTPTLSERVTLVQEDENNTQNGFLLMTPVFSTEPNNDTENNDSSVLGMVNVVFRINDFIEGIIDKQKFEFINMRIYDESVTPENLFFDSNVFFEIKEKEIEFSKIQNLEIANRNWIIEYGGINHSLNDFEIFFIYLLPIIGFSLSGLLFYVFYLNDRGMQLMKNSIKTKKLENIGKLAAALAHDLRNPLSVASGAMYLLAQKSENLDDKSKNLILKSNTAIERMRHQINDVMNYVQTGQLQISEVSLKEILDMPEVTQDVSSNISMNLPQNDVLINCDKRKMIVLLSNLISNASQAIGDKTGTITVRFIEEEKNVIIEVEDSGPGIPKESLKNIFEPMYTTKPKGTGLGLASCKHIVDSHKGTIEVTNNPTLFRISLPK